jgi:hypothetical protein
VRAAEARAADERLATARRLTRDAEQQRTAIDTQVAAAQRELEKTRSEVAALRDQRRTAEAEAARGAREAPHPVPAVVHPAAPVAVTPAASGRPLADLTYQGREGAGDIEIALSGDIRITEGVTTSSHAELIIDGADPAAHLERNLDVTKYGSPLRTITVVRDPHVPTRIYVMVSLLAPSTPSIHRHAGGVRWHFQGNDMALLVVRYHPRTA